MALRRTAQLLLAATSVTQICASPHGLGPRQDSLPIESCPGYKASNVQQTIEGLRQGFTVSTESLSNHPLLLTMI
jgi:alpha-glucosidase